MALVPYPAGKTPAERATKTSRNLPLDRARTFLTIIVLIHHAVIPYTYFGHTDPKSWLGFDIIVLATDSFFMAMFFMLSGLFVWPSLSHKVPGAFTRDRLVRLGLPFVIAALTVIPIAYYAIALRQAPIGFTEFWWKTVTVGPWPSGPIWFTWVLLLFDIIAAIIFRLEPGTVEPINRLSVRGFTRPFDFFGVLVAVSAVVYVPLRVSYGPSHWFEFGPFSVQSSRVWLYATYFFFGAGIGAANFDRGLLSPDGQLAKGWTGWAVLTVIAYCPLWVLIYIKREVLGNPPMLPTWYEATYGLVFVIFSAAIMFAIMAFFLRFKREGWSLLDPLQHDAYGIFLVHYVFVLWLQYWLFNFDLPAIVKAFVALVGTLVLSWATSAALRQIPGSRRVL